MDIESDPRLKKAALAGIAENRAMPPLDREYARGYVHGFEAAEATGALESLPGNIATHLGILLEYAYRGVAVSAATRPAGGCHVKRADSDREAGGCPVCDALTWAETRLAESLSPDEMPSRTWWVTDDESTTT